jgi:hypothetical protein
MSNVATGALMTPGVSLLILKNIFFFIFISSDTTRVLTSTVEAFDVWAVALTKLTKFLVANVM